MLIMLWPHWAFLYSLNRCSSCLPRGLWTSFFLWLCFNPTTAQPFSPWLTRRSTLVSSEASPTADKTLLITPSTVDLLPSLSPLSFHSTSDHLYWQGSEHATPKCATLGYFELKVIRFSKYRKSSLPLPYLLKMKYVFSSLVKKIYIYKGNFH